jgi:hypothetical protein
MSECKFDCPLRKKATTFVPYGDIHVSKLEYYCAADDDPETCAMMNEDEDYDEYD